MNVIPYKKTKTELSLVTADTKPKQTRKKYSELRPREFLKLEEVDKLIGAAKSSRNGKRDALMIQLAFGHALRATELVNLEWDQIDFAAGTIRVVRAKNGTPSTQYLSPLEIRALKQLRKETQQQRYVFLSERQTPMTERGFHKLISVTGERAGFEFPLHPHMLRHSKGYQLANRGTDTRLIQGFLGHVSIQHTVRYTALDPKRFKGLEV